jgi:hypothetical protein
MRELCDQNVWGFDEARLVVNGCTPQMYCLLTAYGNTLTRINDSKSLRCSIRPAFVGCVIGQRCVALHVSLYAVCRETPSIN